MGVNKIRVKEKVLGPKKTLLDKLKIIINFIKIIIYLKNTFCLFKIAACTIPMLSWPGVGACLKKFGSRVRTVTQKRSQGRFLVGYAARFPVTHGYVSRLPSPVLSYAWLRKLVTQPGSRLRMVTLFGYAARFPVMYGYLSWLQNPVPGYACMVT